MVASPPVLAFAAICAACIFGMVEVARAQDQNGTNAVTDPAEARALNSIFQQWGISARSGQWNISGELCSGAAIDTTSFDDGDYNPFIKCDCSYNSSSTCHITQLKVYALDVVGVIPEQLWTLTYLIDLNLGQNYLTGNLSASIGNLTRMQYLSVGINALSGELPKELGNLSDLLSFGFGSNNFSGSLPSELGNLVKLQQIYFDSSGVSGEIPSTFAKLQNLHTVWASDNELTGSIPDFIATWSNSCGPNVGEPLSTLLFGFVMEAFSRMLPDDVGGGFMCGFSFEDINQGTLSISHLLFANLILYDVDHNRTQSLRMSSLPMKYLGLPLGANFKAKSIWIDVIEKIELKLTSWKMLYLSKGGNGCGSISMRGSHLWKMVIDAKYDGAWHYACWRLKEPISDRALKDTFSTVYRLAIDQEASVAEVASLISSLSDFSYCICFVYLGTFSILLKILRGKKKLSMPESCTILFMKFSVLLSINSVTHKCLTITMTSNSSRKPSFIAPPPGGGGGVVGGLVWNHGALPSGLNCLQRSFPCNRGLGRYSDFRIKCGGPQITSSSGITYERDNATLGPATYYVTDTNRWAVSNVGYFTGTMSSQFIGTLDSELFQTTRVSASSLRYYGLGLQNGNYTVSLQFAEIEIQNPPTWRSLGKRVFDIYIQGNRSLKDFDIRKEAGWSNQPVRKEFTVQVSENYLEIHLFWAGKGTCCIPAQGTYGPSISAISATPDFEPTVSNEPPSNKKNRTGLIVGIVVGAGVLSFLSVFVVFYFVKGRKQLPLNDDEVLLGIDARPFTFSYAELKTATEDFNPANKLGEGGFGPVYKGTLSDGRVIAVKQLSVASHQGKNQFIAEIATISAVQHRNLVKLYGCCIEGDKRLLVYEFLENRSLDQALFGKRSLNLNWSTRHDICLGVARGLAYLHEESRLRIVHRDVKASNILLDSELIPKISDFGLAKLYDDKKTHISTRVAGTIGYLAPEYAMRGHLTEKADVFAFGVVALEVVSGRSNSDSSLEEEKMYLLEWAWHLHENNCEVDLVDSTLLEYNEEEVKRLIGISLLCTQASPALRPTMSRVVAMLTGDTEVSSVTSRPGYLTDWKFDDITSSMSDVATKGKSYFNSPASTSMVGDAENSPVKVTKPLLDDTINDGR
ncbi:hypothetical protein F2P56_004003 [Juglans regia]|uniref:non-specific serine/threonine protein kinase n=1 Tax=Juglans regia TaxID=51240 RepID=A0A834D145_JUGRE|nr:hypothetical protein F2P56_004003 [Juglans regia]